MNVALRLPDSLGVQLKEVSKLEHISMNQFIATAIAEKMSALATFDYLSKRASKANRNDFEAIMAKVPNKKPLKGDEI